MPLDLNAARALHDRDPNNPEACPTCVSPNDPHQMARWPCTTAVALGATGRTEWEDEPDTLRRVRIPEAGWYHIGNGARLTPGTTTEVTFDSEPATHCGNDANYPIPPCTLPLYHNGPHEGTGLWEAESNAATTRWPNQDNPCPLTSTSRGYLRKCVFHNDHVIPHHLGPEQSYTPCQHEYPGSYQCALNKGHDGNHRALNGGTL